MNPTVDPVAAVRSQFLARCREDVAALQAAMADPAGKGRKTLLITIHQLSGAAGVFGFRAISEMAGELDDALQAGETPEPADVQALVDAVKAIL